MDQDQESHLIVEYIRHLLQVTFIYYCRTTENRDRAETFIIKRYKRKNIKGEFVPFITINNFTRIRIN